MLDILDSMAGIVSRELRSVREKVDVEDVVADFKAARKKRLTTKKKSQGKRHEQ